MTTIVTPAKKVLPAELTSYDLIKALAVVIMVTDHIGMYFFPDVLCWRAVGRIGFPVWFFFAGYSLNRTIPPRVLVAGVALLVSNYVTGLGFFPLNALFSIMAIWLTIDRCMKPVMEGRLSIWALSAILFVLILPTYFLCEYGTQALITAIFGYLVRHRDKVQNENLIIGYMIFALLSFAGMQKLVYNFSNAQFAVVLGGTLVFRYWLYNFKPETFPALTAKLPRIATAVIQFMGRNTLEIYVIHLIMFKVAALYAGIGDFEWFRFRWMIEM